MRCRLLRHQFSGDPLDQARLCRSSSDSVCTTPFAISAAASSGTGTTMPVSIIDRGTRLARRQRIPETSHGSTPARIDRLEPG